MRKQMAMFGFLLAFSTLLGVVAFSQGRIQLRGAGQNPAQVNMQDAVVLTGTVAGFNLGSGQGMPSITLRSGAGEVTILAGPYRLLAASNLAITNGQTLEIKAFPDPRFANAYLAVEIRDVATGAVVPLRGENAAVLGPMGRGMQGAGFMAGLRGAGGRMRGLAARETCILAGGGVNANAKTTLDGPVQTVQLSPGSGVPSFTMLSGDAAVTVIASPYRGLLDAGFRISAGDRLSVAAFPVEGAPGQYLAAEIGNLTTQQTLKLRDDAGAPLGSRGRGPCWGGLAGK